MCQWMPVPMPRRRLPPPTCSWSVVSVSVFFSSLPNSRMTRVRSPANLSGQWHPSHVSRAVLINSEGGGTGFGTLLVSTCTSWRVPLIFDSISAPAPGPT